MSDLGPLSAAFLGKAAAQGGGAWAALPDLEGALGALVDRCRALWPEVDLSPPHFSRHLGERWPDLSPPDPAFAALNAGDLYLACACAHGRPAALRAFEARYLAQLPGMLSYFRPSATFVDEVGQRLRERLLCGTPPRIADYGGRGALLVWLRAAAVRTALNLLEEGKVGARPYRDDEALLQGVAAGPLDPELACLKRRDGAPVKEALRQAFAALEADQRNVLRLYYLDGLKQEEIAALYRVHKATVSRWLVRAEEALGRGVRRQLGERVADSEVDGLLALVMSQLATSLVGLLREA